MTRPTRRKRPIVKLANLKVHLTRLPLVKTSENLKSTESKKCPKVYLERLPLKDMKNITEEPVPKKTEAKKPITIPTKNFYGTSQVSNGKIQLRKRTLKNYAEISIRSPSVSITNTETERKPHVPVYLQNKEATPPVNKKDLYEFVSDSASPKKKHKHKKRVTDESFKLPKNIAIRKYAELIDNKKVIRNLARKNINVNRRRKKVKFMEEKNWKPKELRVNIVRMDFDKYFKQKNADGIREEFVVASEANESFEVNDTGQDDSFFGFSLDDNENKKKIAKAPKRINIISNIVISPASRDLSLVFKKAVPNAHSTLIKPSRRRAVPWRPDLDVHRNPHLLKVKTNALPFVDQEIILDSTFVHDETNNSVRENTPKKDPVQQSILNYVTGSNTENYRDNIVEMSLFDSDKYSPIKVTYEAEVVLEQRVVIPAEDISPQYFLEKSHNENYIEKVLNEDSFENSRNDEILEGNKENMRNNNITTRVKRVRRKILGELSFQQLSTNENRNISTCITEQKEESLRVNGVENYFGSERMTEEKEFPISSLVEKEISIKETMPAKQTEESRPINGIEDYFGFESVSEEKETPVSNLKDQVRDSKNLPNRIPVVKLVNILKTEIGRRFHPEYAVEHSESINNDFDSDFHQDVEDENRNDMKLFEDPEPVFKPCRKSYDRIFIKRRKHVPMQSEDDDAPDAHVKKKKRKDARTRAEELEAERWAESFNAMCEEVDKYELEIE